MSELLTRRQAAALALSACLPPAALAQSPRSLQVIVPFPAGGTADILPRLLAEKMQADFPGGIVIDNRSGAGGNIGAEQVYRAKPDGTVLLASPPGPVAVNQNLYRKLNFDPTRFVPITVIATVPNVLDISTSVPAQDLKSFLAYLKANPGKVTYASQGNGTTSHLSTALFMQLTGTTMTHIPYKGTAPALVDLVGGRVDVFFDNISSSAKFYKEGKLRILAVADEQRSKMLPQVPTFAEAGLPDMNAVTFFSVLAPPGTPADVVASLYKSLAGAINQPDVLQRFDEQGAEPRAWTPEETAKFIRAESERWNKIIKSANVTVE
jgi:tripartite-type tricarboxylate transporter receptor subunit TctC